MEDLLFQLLQVVVGVVCVLIARYLLPCVKRFLNNENTKTAVVWADIVVEAMEQAITGGKMGAEKKEKALHELKKILNNIGVKLSDAQIDVLIESAVKVLNDEKKVLK